MELDQNVRSQSHPVSTLTGDMRKEPLAQTFLKKFLAIYLAIHALVAAFAGVTVPGWVPITVPLYMLGGFILLSLGVVGEYIVKIFIEVKRRQRYLIDCVE